jgi:hypothetical protein
MGGGNNAVFYARVDNVKAAVKIAEGLDAKVIVPVTAS